MQRKQVNVRCLHVVDSLSGLTCTHKGKVILKENEANNDADKLLLAGKRPSALLGLCGHKAKPSRQAVSRGNRKRWLKK